MAWDADLSGFGVRIMPTGKRVYFWQGRTQAGRSVKVTIGRADRVTTEQARQKAREIIAEAELGGDPAERRKAERRAKRERTPERTMAALWRLYEREHLPGKRDSSQTADRRIWHQHVEPRFGRQQVAALTGDALKAWHRDLSASHGKFAANRAAALVSTMLGLVRGTWFHGDNPASAVKRHHEEGRERFLSREEIERLIGVLEAQGDLAAKCCEFMLLCGCRRGEALGAEWQHFDLTAGVWTKPSSSVKSKRRHRVPLSPEAVALLAGLPTRATESGPFATLPVWTLTRRWFAIRAEAGLTDVRLHDLRHSFASLLASSGLSLPVIGALLGHSQPSTTARYSHLLDDALREAATKVGAAVRGNGNNVVQLPATKGAS